MKKSLLLATKIAIFLLYNIREQPQIRILCQSLPAQTLLGKVRSRFNTALSGLCACLLVIIGALVLMSCASGVNFKTMSPLGLEDPLILSGTLKKPAGNGPFPAVVLLHGCSGLHLDWANRLTRWGYVTLIVDSLGPRHVSQICDFGHRVPPLNRALDAYGAKSFLETLPYVDSKRIAVMGWSHGGWSVLYVAGRDLESLRSLTKYPLRPFNAAVAFYPWCEDWPLILNAPLLILIGEKDDWTPADRCRRDRLLHSEPQHECVIKVYPGVYHSFDNSELRGMVIFMGHRLEYNFRAASDSHKIVREFLEKHLR